MDEKKALLTAADISLRERIAMVDAIIVAAAQANGSNIIPSDADL